MSLGIVVHVVLSYFPLIGDGWPYTDPAATTNEAGLTFDFIHLFRMPAFFALSGFFAALLWRRRGAGAMLRNRFDRLVLPFVFFVLLLWPAQVFTKYFAYSSLEGRAQSPWKAAVEQTVERGFPPQGTMHLWFLYDLIFITMIAAFVVWGAGRLGIRSSGLLRLVRRCTEGPWLCLTVFTTLNILWFLPLEWVELPTSGAWFPDPVLLSYYLLCYGLGWMVFASKVDLSSFELRAWTFIGLGCACVAVRAVGWFAMEGYEAQEGVDPPSEIVFWFLVRASAACLALVALTRGSIGVFLRHASSGSAAWRYVSDSSYWVYLVHLPLAFFVPPLMVHWNIPAQLKCWIALAVVALLCVSSYDVLVRPTAVGRLLNGRTHPSAHAKLSAGVFLVLASSVTWAAVSLVPHGGGGSPWQLGKSAGELLPGEGVREFSPESASMPPGLDPGTCVEVDPYVVCTGKLEYTEAVAACAALGTRLVVLESARENRHVTDLVRRLSKAPFRVGITDAVEDGTWVWLDGSPLTYDPWVRGEPNNWGGQEACVGLNWKDLDGWVDLPCDNAIPFVCELR